MGERILVVEDDPHIRELVTEILELADFQVSAVGNGEEALEDLARETPAAMLLDLRLPVLDGWAVVRRLRERGQHVPTIVMTGDYDARRSCAALGTDACLQKPFELETLLDEVIRVRTREAQGR